MNNIEDKIEKNKIISISYNEILFLILVSAGLYITSLSGYLLFHGLVEIFSIAVAICIFMIAWNSREKIENNYLLFIGISLLFTAAIDLLHTLAFKGMGVFPGNDANLPTQLWIAARYLQSISLLIAPLFFYPGLKLKLNVNYLFFIYSIVFSLLIASIFYWKNFPDCFIEEKGLTTFKIVSEYVISLIMAASIFLLYKNRREFEDNVFSLLVASIILLIFSEMAFTAYANVFGFSNMLGHIFKFIAFYLIYKAIIVTGFMKPYDLIFRDLKNSEDELKKHQDHLGELIHERTAELVRTNQELNSELMVRIKTEKALKEQYSTLRSIINSANALIFSVDRQYRYTSFNKGHAATMKALYGVDIEYGHSLLDYMIVPEDRKTARYNLDRALAGEQLVEESYSGEELRSRQYFQVSHSPVKTETGEIIGVAVLAQDMTERKRAEEALRESEARLREAQKIAHIGNWELNLLTNTLIWSDEIFQIFEIDRERFGASYEAFLDAIHPEDRDAVNSAYTQSLKTRKAYEITHRLLMRDGRIKYVQEQCHTYYSPEGKPLRSIGIVQDITERKRAEEELQKYRDHLEELVKERTDSLTTKTNELNQANIKLKELDKLKSMFIASMSHELRTPLNSIIGFSGMTLQGLSGDLNEEQKDNLTRVTRSAEHLLALINDIIDISKIEAGRVEVFPEKFSLHELIAEAVHTIRPQAEQKSLALVVDVPTDIKMNTDRKRLLQCILNYLSNAIKFTEVGKVTIQARRVNGDVEISVIDTGIGITEKNMPQLFEAFERLESHLKLKAGGTGLGLYLTKKMATELLHGSVGVESIVGKGSKFRLRIPEISRNEGEIK